MKYWRRTRSAFLPFTISPGYSKTTRRWKDALERKESSRSGKFHQLNAGKSVFFQRLPLDDGLPRRSSEMPRSRPLSGALCRSRDLQIFEFHSVRLLCAVCEPIFQERASIIPNSVLAANSRETMQRQEWNFKFTVEKTMLSFAGWDSIQRCISIMVSCCLKSFMIFNALLFKCTKAEFFYY